MAIANANIEQSKVDLAHCTVRSPIDGVVISRNVDEGQTVTARLAAPTLFVLATDLTRLQIVADVDESDVSRIRAGQTVGFTVDAYAGHRFEGKVTIVRLNATTTNNVVTYQVVADVPNPDLRLMPGMTATIGIEIWHANGVLRIPSAALRYRPVDDVFATFGQSVPPEAHVRPRIAGAGVAAHAGAATPLRAGSTIDQFFRTRAPAGRARPGVGDAGPSVDAAGRARGRDRWHVDGAPWRRPRGRRRGGDERRAAGPGPPASGDQHESADAAESRRASAARDGR